MLLIFDDKFLTAIQHQKMSPKNITCVSDHTCGTLLTGQSVIKMASDIDLTGKPTVPDEPGRNVTKIAFLSALGLTREVVT